MGETKRRFKFSFKTFGRLVLAGSISYAAYVGLITYVAPQIDFIGELRRQKAVLTQDLQELQRKEVKQRNLEATVKGQQEELLKVLNTAQSHDAAMLYATLTTEAQTLGTNVRVHEVKEKTYLQSGGIWQIPVEVTVHGDFLDLAKFMEVLRQYDKSAVIQDMHVQRVARPKGLDKPEPGKASTTAGATDKVMFGWLQADVAQGHLKQSRTLGFFQSNGQNEAMTTQTKFQMVFFRPSPNYSANDQKVAQAQPIIVGKADPLAPMALAKTPTSMDTNGLLPMQPRPNRQPMTMPIVPNNEMPNTTPGTPDSTNGGVHRPLPQTAYQQPAIGGGDGAVLLQSQTPQNR